MFHRIDMKVRLVADQMFPIPPLPDAPFAPCHRHRRTLLDGWYPLRERRLDQAPAHSGIGIAGRQFEDAVEVFGQHDPRMNGERRSATDKAQRIAQHVDVPDQQIVTVTLQQIDGEEIGAAG